MLFYRMPEGLLAKVSALFLIDAGHNGGLGLSPAEYGLVQGTVGVVGLTIGGILGGIAASRDGLKQWLWPMVCAITLPDVVYVYLSYALPTDLMVINVCVFVEQFGYGFGFSAYMLYLIYYSRGEHKTSHYALCTALMALSMMIPALCRCTPGDCWLPNVLHHRRIDMLHDLRSVGVSQDRPRIRKERQRRK